MLRRADVVFIEELRAAGLYDTIWQAFAVLLPVQPVGVMGDARTYDFVCALRAVTSVDGMTADYYKFDHAFLDRVAGRRRSPAFLTHRVINAAGHKPLSHWGDWCRRSELNTRPHPYQGCALPLSYGGTPRFA